jgi:hypothetical protein
VAGAVVAALCFMTKPSGALVIALVGSTWLVIVAHASGWNWTRLWAQSGGRGYLVGSALPAAAIFAVAAIAAARSEYFSPENLGFADRVFAVLQDEILTPVSTKLMVHLIGISFGYVMPVLSAIGLALALGQKPLRGHGTAAFMTIAVGLWFWLIQTEPAEIRYFLPFGVMAFILAVPALVGAFDRIAAGWAVGLAILSLAPALAIAVLLFVPQPPPQWQRALGINLDTNMYAAEAAQAGDLLTTLKAEQVDHATVYLHDATQATRAFHGVIDHARLVDPTLPQVALHLPIDWQRPSAYRFDEMAAADFIAFEPLRDQALMGVLRGRRAVSNIYDQVSLFRAWLTALGPEAGVDTVSETRLRLLRLADPVKFEAAWAALEEAHDWPTAFREANPRRWWSVEDVLALPGIGARAVAVAFRRRGEPHPAATLRAAAWPDAEGRTISLWFDGAPAEADSSPGDWYLFAHALDAQGAIIANAQQKLKPMMARDPAQPLRRHDLMFAAPTTGATTYGTGFFRLVDGQIAEMLTVDAAAGADMDGQRARLDRD